MPVPYSLATAAYHAGVRLASVWNAKARAWVRGRTGLWQRLEARREALQGCLWMHCASVGEFEQGRPMLEAIKAKHPDLPVLLTFFSPSGYEARKDLPLATHVEYLPPDSAANAQRLVRLLAPRMALFVKYEFWYHHLHALKDHAVPTYLVSALFRPGQPFFHWYGGAWRSMLRCYTRIFTQDDRSRELLAGLGLTNVSVSGDTRFDRVAAIVQADEDLPEAAAFMTGGGPVLIAGSTWPADERLILGVLADMTGLRSMIAPHELTPEHLAALHAAAPRPLAPWSAPGDPSRARTLLVDRMGLLARLYKYGHIAYVGGGFGDGIHSLLEAAAWGRPVIFGPVHHKFPEAAGLVACGGGFAIRDEAGLRAVMKRLVDDPHALATASRAARDYVTQHAGATDRVMAALGGL